MAIQPRREFLYVAQFSDGTLKVGRSIRPEIRLAEHRAAAECFGLAIHASQTFACAGDAVQAEQSVLARCAAQATSVRRAEWFSGIPFAQACELAREFASCKDADPLRDALWRAGGPAAVARRLGISVDTVRKWDAIPARHRREIEAMSGDGASRFLAALMKPMLKRLAA